MCETINIENVHFVGLGKILFDFGEKWNIPQLHFLVSKENSVFIAVNLEMQLFSSGDTEDKAIASLIDLTMSHIKAVMKRNNFAQFIEDAKSCIMEKYWSKYRELEFSAALEKQDLSNDVEQRIYNILKEMIEKELEKQNISIQDIVERAFAKPKIMYREAA